jgi:hypothetical protein
MPAQRGHVFANPAAHQNEALIIYELNQPGKPRTACLFQETGFSKLRSYLYMNILLPDVLNIDNQYDMGYKFPGFPENKRNALLDNAAFFSKPYTRIHKQFF